MGLDPFGTDRRLRVVDLGENTLAGLEIGPAGFGERQAAGRPVQEPRAESRLQGRDMLGDPGLREAERPPGGREAAECGDAAEDLHSRHAVEHGNLTLSG